MSALIVRDADVVADSEELALEDMVAVKKVIEDALELGHGLGAS
jgi:hypothetical protein